MTSYCFANCSMCPREEIKDFGYISNKTMAAIVAQIDPNFVWEIDLSGRGEPTLHPQLSSILKELKNCSVKSALVTTGVLLTPQLIETLNECVDKIRLSISSFDPSTFSKVHCSLNYQNIWKNIELLSRSAAEKVTCHLIGGPIIYEHLPLTVSKLRSMGYKRIYLFPLWNRGGLCETKQEKGRRMALIEELKIQPSEVEYSGDDLYSFSNDFNENIKNNHNYCSVGDSSLAISYNGDIIGCFQDFGHKIILGNIHKNTLKEIYFNRKSLLGNMSVCKSCNTKNEAILETNKR